MGELGVVIGCTNAIDHSTRKADLDPIGGRLISSFVLFGIEGPSTSFLLIKEATQIFPLQQKSFRSRTSFPALWKKKQHQQAYTT